MSKEHYEMKLLFITAIPEKYTLSPVAKRMQQDVAQIVAFGEGRFPPLAGLLFPVALTKPDGLRFAQGPAAHRYILGQRLIQPRGDQRLLGGLAPIVQKFRFREIRYDRRASIIGGKTRARTMRPRVPAARTRVRRRLRALN